MCRFVSPSCRLVQHSSRLSHLVRGRAKLPPNFGSRSPRQGRMREKFESLRSPPGTQLGAQGQPECMHCCICPPSLPSSCDLGFMTAGCLPSVLAPSPFMPTGVASCVALGLSSDLADAAAAKSRGHSGLRSCPRHRPSPTGVASCVALGVSSDLADAAAAKSRGHSGRRRDLLSLLQGQSFVPAVPP